MAAVVLPLCLEAQIPDKSPLTLVLNGTPFAIREGQPIPKSGEEPGSETCYLVTQAGTWHVRLSVAETLRRLVPVDSEQVGGFDQPPVVPSITADSIKAGSVTSADGDFEYLRPALGGR